MSSQLEEVRKRAESLLASTGSAQDVKADVGLIANMGLSLSEKYCQIGAEIMLRENTARKSRPEVMESLGRLFKALGILEKYGCNLTNSNRPRYWRSVKHNNPVFRATVDAIQGGRAVLHHYGYVNQQPDGLSFPENVIEPDVSKVAAVTVEVMILRSEVDMLIKGTHPHLEVFKDIIPWLNQQDPFMEESDALVILPGEEPGESLTPSLMTSIPDPAAEPSTFTALLCPIPSSAKQCNLCGGTPSLLCPSCGSLPFCGPCDDLYHRHPFRADHAREKMRPTKPETCSICGMSVVSTHCVTCDQKLCLNCDRLYHSHPDRGGHSRTPLTPVKALRLEMRGWQCAQCTTVNDLHAVLCLSCERPRLASPAAIAPEDVVLPSASAEWQCKSCTVVNQGSSVLCEVCERPRLATRPSVVLLPSFETEWMCDACTYVNSKSADQCEMCDYPCKESLLALSPLSPSKGPAEAVMKPQPVPRVNKDLKRQKLMKEHGIQLVNHIREAEKRGVSPEEVYAALHVPGNSNVNPCDWLKSELPHLLDEICATAASVKQNYNTGTSGTEDSLGKDGGPTEPCGPPAAGEGRQLSRAEAKQAWLAAEGDTERAVKKLLRDRRAKVRELGSMGLRKVSQCEEALRLSGGDVKGALSLLQRPLLEHFHQRIWSDQLEAPFDAKDPDKQRLCRRLLALYELPSWGRCELALSLLQEPDTLYSLEDVVQAVKESQDRDFIRRLLNNECPCCLSIGPRWKMQSLTSCQCSVCHDCFKQHFTYAVRDKHIRDMVCPVCAGPDINDPEQLDSYFSTLDIQLRDCLELDVYDLYHKKLRDHALMKDPKFLWCCHCTFGFIFDGNQLKVTCPTCNKSFCAQCKKPWEVQHQDASCQQFQLWKKENDPEYQKQGLAGFLRDNGITCPNCRFPYALAKGGCMHFTCSQCRYQFCSGCNNPYHTTACKTAQCKIP
ncbi:E3 ubiquitin-protein ligase RNF31-like, partial [Aplochiton taeniatus]